MMARGITEKMSHFRNTLFMSKPSLGAPESFRVIKKLLVSPFAVEDTGDPMGGDGLFIDLTDAPDGVGCLFKTQRMALNPRTQT